MYIESFRLPDIGFEECFVNNDVRLKSTCYKSVYPFKIFPQKGLRDIELYPITIFYGTNGSGKTTLLNVIAEKLKLERGTYYNESPFFEDYVKACSYELNMNVTEIPKNSHIITSDDVFDYMINIRCLNNQIDYNREKLLDEYTNAKNQPYSFKTLDDYEELRKSNEAKSRTYSKYVKKRLTSNVKEQSNGESAFMFFTEKIKDNALYLLDEPENSLAVDLQIKLMQFIEESARFYNCQFIIATHSPFLMSMKKTKIYDLDSNPVCIRKWTELKNVRLYHDFFKEREDEFD